MATRKPIAKKVRGTRADIARAKAEAAAQRLVEAKARRDEANEDILAAEQELMDYLAAANQKSVKLPLGTFTRVQKETVKTDYNRLKTAVGTSIWNKITTRQVDKEKLESKVADGTISTATLAECSEVIPNKPYILATIKKGS